VQDGVVVTTARPVTRSDLWLSLSNRGNSDELESPSRSFTYYKPFSSVGFRTAVQQMTRFQLI